MPRRELWFNPTNTARHLQKNEEKRIQICQTIDGNNFDWQVWAVAASGFFTDSYNLFSTNVILSSLSFVYWTRDTSHSHETIINGVTLAGTAVGQLLFGVLADKFGRRKLYGWELITVIAGTLGVVQSSSGVRGSMSFMGWFVFYRLLMGIGIGGEYPLSAVITAEFAPVRSRARMMAAVFLMQSLGQLAASLVGLVVLLGVGRSRGLPNLTSEEDYDAAVPIVDTIWRCVIGVGAFPAAIAILFRVTIPESPRFTLDVENNAKQALLDAKKYYGDGRSPVAETPVGTVDDPESVKPPQHMGAHSSRESDDDIESISALSVQEPRVATTTVISQNPIHATPFSRQDITQYFWVEGNWRYLAGTSLCWFLLDFAFYGLGMNNPRVLAKIWTSSPLPPTTDSSLAWDTHPSPGNNGIYEVLKTDAIHSIITVSIGSVLGSAILIKVINYIPRKTILAWSFIALAVLLAITGSTFFKASQSNLHALTITFYVLCQLIFNLGAVPDSMTATFPFAVDLN
ncbi:MAG: hypothetical protein Q9217_001116 [Psora testacea]